MSLKQQIKDINRLRQVVDVLFEKEFGYLVQQLKLKSYLIFHKRLQRSKFEKNITSHPERARETMEELGGAFIKLGQFLSLRSDFLPEKYIKEFQKLQDTVPPFTFNEAESIIKQELGKPIKDIFLKIEKTPIAAASIGQVHKAWLKNGKKVAIKVQRPHIEEKFKTDIDILYHVAHLLKKHYHKLGDFNIQEILEEFERYTKKELNYKLESRNIDSFHKIFHNDKNIKIPKVYQDLTTPKVLTMEYISGIKLSQWLKQNKNLKVRKKIAINLTDTILQQIFSNHLFHADPHPGNIVIQEKNKIALLDLGIVGKINSDLQENLENMFIAIVKPDREMLAQSMIDMGIVKDEVNLEKFKEDLSEHLGAYYDISLGELNMSEYLSDIIQLGREYNIRFPVNLLLLVKTVATTEGTSRQLSPELNYISRWKIQCKKIIKKRKGPSYILDSLKQNSFELRNFFKDLPKSMKSIVSGKKNMTIHVDENNIQRFTLKLDTAINRVSYGIIISALILASALLANKQTSNFYGISYPSIIFLTAAILIGIALYRSILNEKGGI